MNDLFGQLAKLVPVSGLTFIAVVWIILKALPDSAQFFGDFFPGPRRLRRTREAVEILKAKIEVYALSKENDFQTNVSMQDAVAPELSIVLSQKNNSLTYSQHVNKPMRIAYAIFLGVVFELVIYGLASNQKIQLRFSDLPSFLISFACVLFGAYSGHRFDMDDYRSKAYYYLAGVFGFVGAMGGFQLGSLALTGIYSLVGLKT